MSEQKMWIFGSKPWWQFWNPSSGFAGGCVFGLIIWIVLYVLILQ